MCSTASVSSHCCLCGALTGRQAWRAHAYRNGDAWNACCAQPRGCRPPHAAHTPQRTKVVRHSFVVPGRSGIAARARVLCASDEIPIKVALAAAGQVGGRAGTWWVPLVRKGPASMLAKQPCSVGSVPQCWLEKCASCLCEGGCLKRAPENVNWAEMWVTYPAPPHTACKLTTRPH